ncbi:MAG TPA: DUF2760 domain-containing protein [Gemmataceae bacterium]|nr:DUF2760 domain-containing protein [Gemmataceae bacterium]
MLENPWVVVLLTVVAVLALRFLIVLLLSGGDLRRIGLTIRSSLKTLRDAKFAEKVKTLLEPPPPPPPPKPSGVPLRILALLQREGRLIDFLTENLQGASDEQIAAAIKDLQPKWMTALNKYLELTPVINQPEQSQVEVPAGFDPSAVQLTGNVTGEPPFKGTLVHGGWRVKEIRIPTPPEGQDEFVLKPAEVELP